MSIASDADVDGLRKLTAAIHQSGTKAFAQLNHADSAGYEKTADHRQTAAENRLQILAYYVIILVQTGIRKEVRHARREI